MGIGGREHTHDVLAGPDRAASRVNAGGVRVDGGVREMRRSWSWLLAMPMLAAAADDAADRGAAVYRASCGVVYCHGSEGKAGRAPALAGRGLAARAIIAIATGGIPNTSMPAF